MGFLFGPIQGPLLVVCEPILCLNSLPHLSLWSLSPSIGSCLVVLSLPSVMDPRLSLRRARGPGLWFGLQPPVSSVFIDLARLCRGQSVPLRGPAETWVAVACACVYLVVVVGGVYPVPLLRSIRCGEACSLLGKLFG